MASDYIKTADGTDGDGRRWEWGHSGEDVILTITLVGGMFATGRLKLAPADRDHFVRAYMQTETDADRAGIPAIRTIMLAAEQEAAG